ncbi:MAG TPA: hypothetical protein VK783_16510 [Bacteroidia bacterium]|jgi:hypothetical protein|nr:hypothetical protein [Bacteroidia bacterium]
MKSKTTLIFSLIIFISLTTLTAIGQVDGGLTNKASLKNFSLNWKADSLGKNLFRYNAVNDTLTGKVRSIYITDILHYKKEQVIELLGKPNKIIHSKGNYSFNYFLAPYYAPPVGKSRYSLQISFVNNSVVGIDTSFIDDSNDGIDVDENGDIIKQ